jgi:DNA-binding beta-propeller fold protein YncE
VRAPGAAVAFLVIWIAALVAGCGGDGRAAAIRAGRTVTQPTSVSCGKATMLGPSLGMARAGTLRLPATPDGVATTPDGRVSFVALQSGAPRIAVLANRPLSERLLRTVRVPAYASGITVTPDGRYALGAVGGGLVVLDVAAARSGAGRALLGSLTAPPRVAGAGPGAAEIAVSRDSRYAFVSLEAAGAIAVFDLDADRSTGFGPRGFLGSIPVGAGALGIAVSPDNRWLYEVSESAHLRSGHRPGALSVINLKTAVTDSARSVIATAAVPCAPVRVAVSPAGTTVWVTAREANALLGFTAPTLRTHPALALVSVTRVGVQPLGVGVADAGRIVLVADSNLSRATDARSGVSVIDVASTGTPKLLGTIPTGKLADAISLRSSNLALVTSSDSKRLEALDLSRLP